MYRNYIKRLLDLCGSLLLLILLSLPLLIIAVITQIDSDGSAFFLQTRSGLHKKPFKIWKFRTLPKDTPDDLPSNDLESIRQTRWQRWMRSSSVDEMPQLINILKGEMSFVGPRPVICEEHDLIRERDKYGANDILPGLTGWAQINGRDEVEFAEKARLDGEYVRRVSLGFDLKCLFLTFFCVLKQDGVKKIKQN